MDQLHQLFHTVDTYLALMVVVVNFVFAILVVVRTPMSILYVIFFFVFVSNMVWNFGDFMLYMTRDRFWLYLSLLGSSMLPALMFHFISVLVLPQRKRTFWSRLAYSFSGFLAFLSLLAISNEEARQFVDSIYWNILYIVLLGPFLLAGILMIVNATRRAKFEDEKSRLRYILTFTVIGVLTGLTDLVQLLKVPVPPLGHLGCLVYSSIMAMAVFKHRAAYDVLAQMRMRLEGLSEMAAGIAHEISNPLASMKGASDLLSRELRNVDHARCREYCGLITEEIERINNIVNNFRYFTRPLKAEKQPVSLNEVIQKTVKLAEVGALNLGIKLELSENLPTIQADASLIKQILLNLIKNAAEACGAAGEVVIKTEKIPSFAKISVSDNGPGVPPELLGHIFEPFFTTKATGMGVGLAISQRIVEAHDGRMEVNRLLPKGTQFSIFLPL